MSLQFTPPIAGLAHNFHLPLASNVSSPISLFSKPTPVDPHSRDGSTQSYWVTYHGGPVIKNVEVRPLWYGNISTASHLDSMYKAVVQSSWWDILSQYGAGRGKAYTGVTIPANIDASAGFVTDVQIQTLFVNMVQAGMIKPTENTYYPLHFPPGVSIQIGTVGASSCQVFCGYHNVIDISSLKVGAQYLKYGVMFDVSDPTCNCHPDPTKTTLENDFFLATQELAEVVVSPAAPLVKSWENANPFGQIGDLCPWQYGTTTGRDGKTYTVQTLWSNVDKACVTAGKADIALLPPVGSVCYPALNSVEVYPIGSVASGQGFNLQWNGSDWNKLHHCDGRYYLPRCYPNTASRNVEGAQSSSNGHNQVVLFNPFDYPIQADIGECIVGADPALPNNPCTKNGDYTCSDDVLTIYQCGYVAGNTLAWRPFQQCQTGTRCSVNSPKNYVGCVSDPIPVLPSPPAPIVDNCYPFCDYNNELYVAGTFCSAHGANYQSDGYQFNYVKFCDAKAISKCYPTTWYPGLPGLGPGSQVTLGGANWYLDGNYNWVYANPCS
ncbi:hypothetical protein HDU79_000451 [Rhizoclosmatium sp. JEL0117]|nr:hypothetical protein HDU79_000451 [Rhizoclosmatium sp. JEL0117]